MFRTKNEGPNNTLSSHFQSISFDSDELDDLVKPSFKKQKTQLCQTQRLDRTQLLNKTISMSKNNLIKHDQLTQSTDNLLQKLKQAPFNNNSELFHTFASKNNLENFDNRSEISVSNIKLQPHNIAKKLGNNNSKQQLETTETSIPSFQSIDWKKEGQIKKSKNAMNKTTQPSLQTKQIVTQKVINNYKKVPQLQMVIQEQYPQYSIVQHHVNKITEQNKRQKHRKQSQHFLTAPDVSAVERKVSVSKINKNSKMTLKDYLFMAKCSSRKAAQIKRNDVKYINQTIKVKTQPIQRELQKVGSLKDIKQKYVHAKYKIDNRQAYQLLKNEIQKELEGIKAKTKFLQEWFQDKQTIEDDHLMQLYDIKNNCRNINQKFAQTTDKLIQCSQMLALMKEEQDNMEAGRSQRSITSISSKSRYLKQI